MTTKPGDGRCDDLAVFACTGENGSASRFQKFPIHHRHHENAIVSEGPDHGVTVRVGREIVRVFDSPAVGAGEKPNQGRRGPANTVGLGRYRNRPVRRWGYLIAFFHGIGLKTTEEPRIRFAPANGKEYSRMDWLRS